MLVRKTGVRALLSLAAAAAVTGGTVAGAQAGTRTDLQRSLDGIVSAGAVGVQAEAISGHRTWRGTSGTARLKGGQPVPRRGLFRIGSTTKTFTATVVMQLVAERKVGLDDPVERYLPGLVPNGENITVRQLLNHTSGLREYLEDTQKFPLKGQDFLDRMRFVDHAPRDLVRAGVRLPPPFPPGTGWRYSNTNYVLAGLIIEKVTGRSYAEEVRRRIIRPLGLGDTSLPGKRTSIPGPHAHGYIQVTKDGTPRPVDITRLNPSWSWAAGEMISTTADVNRFFAALLDGRLLPPAQLKAMKTTVPFPLPNGSTDGLGMVKMPLPCGISVWGKDGGLHGYMTQSVHSEDGRRHLTISANLREFAFAEVGEAIDKTVTDAFCGR
ncbi:class A beta-lactamase-related serine hydrolase [Actinomadura sp. KC345]|uniref:serine hydrolase domain-containing protein n=1 Tax=Actinomadura sp. KC345 TaxID=2530371 RepID=UPI00104FDC93|nr:serine hydrolase domain-containing protein [Actinomadura sp. KC345]TDC55045.1 class A beta-lactamase-related serine hydrolase [Actinomadura sp. KC345]